MVALLGGGRVRGRARGAIERGVERSVEDRFDTSPLLAVELAARASRFGGAAAGARRRRLAIVDEACAALWITARSGAEGGCPDVVGGAPAEPAAAGAFDRLEAGRPPRGRPAPLT